MIYTLLMDSSGRDLSLAIAGDQTILGSFQAEAWQSQSERLVDELSKLAIAVHVPLQRITRIMVTDGPGSYTGVRIAMTVAKTLAFALKASLYTCSSLCALSSFQKKSLCVLDARAGRSYVAVYHRGVALIEDRVISNEDLRAHIQNHPDEVLCGDAEYLGIKRRTAVDFTTMLQLLDANHLAKVIHAVKPRYLKDLS